MLNESIKMSDIKKAKEKVEPFPSDNSSIEIWSKDFFKAAADKIEIIPEAFTQNIFIEGENLEVLKVLQKA